MSAYEIESLQGKLRALSIAVDRLEGKWRSDMSAQVVAFQNELLPKLEPKVKAVAKAEAHAVLNRFR